MRIWVVLPLVVCAGCEVCRVRPTDPSPAFAAMERDIASVPATHSTAGVRVCSAAVAAPASVDLPAFWSLALANNPSLREAAGDVEAARGLLMQASLYPNPRLFYDQNTMGSRVASQGNVLLQLNQEIVTGGKRRLDMAVAGRALDVNQLALLGRKYAILTRVRRAYYEWVGLEATVRVNEDIVASLQRAVEVTRRQVEEVKTRPRTDVLRLEALRENARITLITNRNSRDAAWRHLAAEVGLPDLPSPARRPAALPQLVPTLVEQAVYHRVLTVHSDLKQALADTDRARLALERAKAQAIPNVTLGAGYSAENVDSTAGGNLTVELPIPVWDRNQGHLYEAKARFAQTIAFQHSTINRLTQDTAAAFARYDSFRQQVERLEKEVLPRFRVSLELLLKGYQAGAAQVTFADVFQAEQDLNAANLTLAEARRNLWLAIADLEGLTQTDVSEEPADRWTLQADVATASTPMHSPTFLQPCAVEGDAER